MPRKKPKKIVIPQLKQHIPVRSKKLTENQKLFLAKALDSEINLIFINGPAGSTKTYMAVYAALRLLSAYQDLDLLYVRTVIESADKGLGALPGDLEEKFNPYMAPLEDKLWEMLPQNTSVKAELFEKERLKAMPINFIRGADWKNKVVVADEAQNFTFKELTTLITRLGENTKLFVCGDSMQSDINGKSGFSDMCDLFSDTESRRNGIESFLFGEDDIMRSKLVKFIIKKLKSP